MKNEAIPLEELSVRELFFGTETYEIPIYQRNYAWEKDEITALVQDIADAMYKTEKYYIGTLVTFYRGDRRYEVIDGQQRLTTLRLLLSVLKETPTSQLTFRARKKSDDTIRHLPQKADEIFPTDADDGIRNGYRFLRTAFSDIVGDKEKFKNYVLDSVCIIRYQVPRDVDLNHYFEVMNSRGEQLEKHEIVKAWFLSVLDSRERKCFATVWDACADMGVYIQQKLPKDGLFGKSRDAFLPEDFVSVCDAMATDESAEDIASIEEILQAGTMEAQTAPKEKPDAFLPIIDFPNFLLIVLKIFRLKEDACFNAADFTLDDKELLAEFGNLRIDSKTAKHFGVYLLKAKYFLDNYTVHHSLEEDTCESNPWQLQRWQGTADKGYRPQNLAGKEEDLQDEDEKAPVQAELEQLLSMFEVSFTARQRKNYLFYCLLYLFENEFDADHYRIFVRSLAEKYFFDVYLDGRNLNAVNTPRPGSFDEVLLPNRALCVDTHSPKNAEDFERVFGKCGEISKGIPLFVFNYLDYRLWKKYADELKGENAKEGCEKRNAFFEALGCGDFGLENFKRFYQSRTRRSLEHYYPRALADRESSPLTAEHINCFGNYAMIGSEINSDGSDRSPLDKLNYYLDAKGKIRLVSVASLKFRIMMKLCEEKKDWTSTEIEAHQKKMLEILLPE